MGTVYAAEDTLLNESVALKFLHPHLLQTQRGVQLFIREAQVARRLRHDRIVATHDVGRTPEGVLYLSMEMLQGHSLRRYLNKYRLDKEPMPVRLAVELTNQILDGLDYAHQFIVHRDLKPENVVIMPGEKLKVLDFGLAKAIDEEDVPREKRAAGSKHRVVGTEAYASPEQKQHGEVDATSDVYAVGLLLHEMLTLRSPREPFVEIEAVRSDVSPSIVAIAEKARREIVGDRWSSASAFRDALMDAYADAYTKVRSAKTAAENEQQASTEGMVLLEGGSFLMGSNDSPSTAPEFEAYVNPFYMDTYPVTVAQYGRYMEATNSPRPKYWNAVGYEGGDQPVVGVTWEEASAYAAWEGKRLPTEKEWEFAARGRENRKYPWGHEAPDKNRANYSDFLSMPSFVNMHEDGSTPDGICDLAGNISEWTFNWFQTYAQQHRGDTPAEPRRTIRGGSWDSPADGLRCTARQGVFPESQLATVGFRCVVSAE
jgi:formylglycine-generating enzyme required for sulfatase activity/tRNA A-37 threonylcarbamoyl transferase component Bud32